MMDASPADLRLAGSVEGVQDKRATLQAGHHQYGCSSISITSSRVKQLGQFGVSKASMARHRTPRGTALAPRQGGIVRQPAATSEPPNLLIPWQGSGRSQICSQGGHRSPVVVPIRDDKRHGVSLFYTAWALLRGCGLVGHIAK